MPYGKAPKFPHDYYKRPVYIAGITFTNVTIPAGTNALFQNCTFIGVTYVATNTDTSDPSYNYVGMTVRPTALRSPTPDRTANVVSGRLLAGVTDTKTPSPTTFRLRRLHLRGLHRSSDVPSTFTQTRDKVEFTGTTSFADTEQPHDHLRTRRWSGIFSPREISGLHGGRTCS